MRFSEIIAKYAAETWATLRTVALGTTATTACAGNDARLSNSRTPTSHASTHATDGIDPVTPASIGAATASQGALADSAVQPEDLGDSAYLDVGTTTGTVAAGDDSRIVAGGTALQPDDTRLAPDGIFFVDGTRTDTYTANGTTARPYKTFTSLVARWSEVAGPITVIAAQATYSAGGSYTVPNYPLVLFANGGTLTIGGTLTVQNAFTAYDLNTTGNVTVGASSKYIRMRGQIDGNITVSGNCDLRGVTVTGAITVNTGGVLTLDSSTTYASITKSGTVNYPVTQTQITASLAQEEAARLAADVALMTGRRYFGGVSTLAAEDSRAGFTRYGSSSKIGPFFANGMCTLAKEGPLKIAITDWDPATAMGRVYVSLDNAGGTAAVRTTTRALPTLLLPSIEVVTDAPASGLLSAASLHVFVNGAAQAIETVTDASGAPLTTASAWYLGADSTGANALSGVISRYGWQVYNYAMSAAQVAAWQSLGSVPYAGTGTMQALRNSSFEQWAGTVDDGTSDAFSGWETLGTGLFEAVSSGKDGGYALKITSTTAACVRQNLPFGDGKTVTVTYWVKNNGSAGTAYSGLRNVADNTWFSDTNGAGFASHGGLTSTWSQISRTFNVPAGKQVSLYLYGDYYASGNPIWIDDVQVSWPGNLLEGLDLAAQPVCVRTAWGSVLYDSATGVAPQPDVRPERMTLATPIALTADGYLIGDRLVHPAGYVVDKVFVTNTGSTAVTATIRASSSSGTVIATGSIAATGLPVPLTVSSATSLTAASGKIYISGATTSAPLSVTIIHQRV